MQRGTYRAKATNAQLAFTDGGKEQVAVEFEITSPGQCFGEMITWYGYFTDKTTERTIKGLRTCGWQGSDLSDLRGVSDNEVSIVIDEEEYQGKSRFKVQWVNALGGGGPKKPMTDTEARAFAARMKGAVLNASQGQPQSSSSSRKPVTKDSGNPEDYGFDPSGDLPF